jgi:hypothetical protein
MLHQFHVRYRPHWAATYVLTGLFLLLPHATACTVFTIAGGEHVLFCNNEDFSNPNTRIWFIPAAGKKNGCVFVGFDDGWGQGGLNSKGLAYGWVAGFKERWQRSPGLQDVRGNPCQRMLESCQTVEEAVAFFRRNWEESFSYGRLLVADRTGKSAILRAKDGKLDAPIVAESQGVGHRFGLRGNDGAEMLSRISKPAMADAVRLLKFTLQEGPNATKYSTIYDLKTRDIDLYRFPEQTEPVRFNLLRELEKGPHYYDIPALPQQLTEPLKPLTDDMKKY